jgi:hypothetical protein
MNKYEKDIFKLLKENGIKLLFKSKYLSEEARWEWSISELNQVIHQRDYYKTKYDEIRKIMGG